MALTYHFTSFFNLQPNCQDEPKEGMFQRESPKALILFFNCPPLHEHHRWQHTNDQVKCRICSTIVVNKLLTSKKNLDASDFAEIGCIRCQCQ